MRPLLFLLVLLFGFTNTYGQVKIGDNPQNISPAAVLELESTTAALIITRVTNIQMQAIVPSQGALVYNTDTACVHYYDGTEWVNLCSSATASINVTTNPIVNQNSTIVITQTADGNNIEVAPESIRTEQILDGSIFGEDINDNSIGPNKLANNSVGKLKLSENAVGPFAIDRDSLPLSFFINDVPFLSLGDLTTVSVDEDNSIVFGADGGAFYNQGPLLEAITVNTAAIAEDLDADPENELQNLRLDGNILTLSDPVNGDNTVDLEAFAGGGGNPTDELQDLVFDETTNILTISTPGTAGNEADLSSLAGGGTGNTEIVDGTVLIGLGTVAEPFTIAPSTRFGQFLRTNTDGNVIWDDLPVGAGGGAVASDGVTIIGDGIATELSVLDEGITPVKIQPSTTIGDFLTTTADGAVAWTSVTPGGGSTEIVDGITLTGVGITGDPFKIEPSTTFGQFLRTDTEGNVIWDDLPEDTGISTDNSTITGDGVATVLSVLDDGITPAKIEPSENVNDILTTNADGDVAWTPLSEMETVVLADQVTITGDGQVSTEFKVADAGITTLQLATDAVSTINILDENITIEKIAAGLEGEVLTTDATGDVVWTTGGEINTASNIGIDGVGVALPKDGSDLPFKNINAASNRILITDDAANNEIDIDIDEANLRLPATQIVYDPNITGDLPITITTTQAAIDALAAAGDSDSQNIIGSGLDGETLIIGIEDGDEERVDLSTFALDTDVAAAIAVSEADDEDTDDENEIELPTGGDDGQVLSTDGAGVYSWIDAGAVENLSNANLTQTADRTYDLDGNNLFFTGTGLIGIGTNSPDAKLHVAGAQVRAATFSAGNGFAYGFSNDPDTGMYRVEADQIAFNVGNNRALIIDEPSTNITNVIVTGGFSTNIRTESGTGTIEILEDDFTVVIENASSVALPAPDNEGGGLNTGQIYILKNITEGPITIDRYINADGSNPNETNLPEGITKLQSDGSNWHQIN